MPLETTIVTKVRQTAAVKLTHLVFSTKSAPPKISRVITKVEVAAGRVADTIKTTDASSKP